MRVPQRPRNASFVRQGNGLGMGVLEGLDGPDSLFLSSQNRGGIGERLLSWRG